MDIWQQNDYLRAPRLQSNLVFNLFCSLIVYLHCLSISISSKWLNMNTVLSQTGKKGKNSIKSRPLDTFVLLLCMIISIHLLLKLHLFVYSFTSKADLLSAVATWHGYRPSTCRAWFYVWRVDWVAEQNWPSDKTKWKPWSILFRGQNLKFILIGP